MKIELHEISIREIVENYVDNDENGVLGYNGKLNIRPKYQREFIYPEDKQIAVIDTIFKGFPLNVMYWCKNSDGTYELLDGQQRTVSFCKYYNSEFSYNKRAYHNLTPGEKDAFLNYKCLIYICEGTEKEKLDWFKVINIAGEELKNQELRNAMYTGEWLTDAKRHFSKRNCAGYNMGKDYINGECDRQAYLEIVLSWIVNYQSMTDIEAYMSKHQLDQNCNELWLYYCNVINWIKTIFPTVRKEMKGLQWGIFYNKYHNNQYDAKTLEKRIKELRLDDEVTNKKGVYEYLLSGDEKTLNLRAFTEAEKIQMFEMQNGECPHCKKTFKIEQMEADHITPWCEGGKTTLANGQMLCKNCNRHKSSK